MIYVWIERTGIAQYPNRVCISMLPPDDDHIGQDALDKNTVNIPIPKFQTAESVAVPLVNVLREGTTLEDHPPLVEYKGEL